MLYTDPVIVEPNKLFIQRQGKKLYPKNLTKAGLIFLTGVVTESVLFWNIMSPATHFHTGFLLSSFYDPAHGGSMLLSTLVNF
jgi:hypothetical protein